jgi:hypothetical protein
MSAEDEDREVAGTRTGKGRALTSLMLLPACLGAAAASLRAGLDLLYRGRPGLSPLTRLGSSHAAGLYAEGWTLVLGTGRGGPRCMLDLLLCNPGDASYLVDTTAAYLSLSFWDGGSGWQLVDRYSLRHFHPSMERGEILLGPHENPRCSLRLAPGDGGVWVAVSGTMERSSFIRREFPGSAQDISWDLRLLFLDTWYPDAKLDALSGSGYALSPCGVSFACRPARSEGALKVNESLFELGTGGEAPAPAWLLQRWGGPFPDGEGRLLCLAGGAGAADAAVFLSAPLPATGPGCGEGRSHYRPSSLFVRRGNRAGMVRDNPLDRRRLRSHLSEMGPAAPGDEGPASLSARVDARLAAGRVTVTAETCGGDRLDLLLPGTHGQCVMRSWYPRGRLLLRGSSGEQERLQADLMVERTVGGWWDRVADFIEIPIDLEAP